MITRHIFEFAFDSDDFQSCRDSHAVEKLIKDMMINNIKDGDLDFEIESLGSEFGTEIFADDGLRTCPHCGEGEYNEKHGETLCYSCQSALDIYGELP